MYLNPLNPRFRALPHRHGHSRETSPPFSSRPQTSRDPERTIAQRLLRHNRRSQEWAMLIGVEKALAAVSLATRGLRTYRSPDNERFEKVVIHTSTERAGEGPDDMHRRCGTLELEVGGSPSERMEYLMFIFDVGIIAESISTLRQVMALQVDVEKTLQECEEVLAPLASPTWIDSHTEGDTVEEAVDEKESSKGKEIDGKTKGKMDKEKDETKDKIDDKTCHTTEDEMDEADEADDKMGKQCERKKKRNKKNKKKRKRRVN
ncbi:hypothetical protein F4782DRAFT_533158 [Xylaria castorea]|nr:hypothetical protein F4782DRAFT_533158 [Xylaria castorea]